MLALCAGCRDRSVDELLASGDPTLRARAAYRLGETPDGPTGTAQLIRLLADRDDGVRFYAAAALRRRTGERFGYRSEGLIPDRHAAIGRWIEWYDTAYPAERGRLAELRALVSGAEEPAAEDGNSGSGEVESSPVDAGPDTGQGGG